MKMITAVVNHEDARAVSQALVKQKFYVTRMASSGGFLMSGNDTLMIVTKDERVDDCIHVIAERCRQRTEVVPNTAGYGEGSIAMPMEVTVGGATIFVTNVERMEKLVKELLYVSKADGKQKSEYKTADFAELVRVQLATITDLLEEKKQRLEVNIPDRLSLTD